MFSLRRVVAAAVAGVLVLGDARAQETPVRTLPAISVVEVETARLTDRVYASGLIAPVERVFVQPQIEGQSIDTVDAEVGDDVAAGQVLARLSDSALRLQRSQLEASRASAEAAIAQAVAQLVEAEAVRDEAVKARERTVELVARGATSQATADQAISNAATAAARVTVAIQASRAAEAQLNVVDAQLADVDLSLRRTEVAAPVAGAVVERNAMVGNIASAVGEPMFVIVRDGLLELRADVAEQDVLRIASGQRVLIRPVGAATPLEGVVHLVEPTVNEASRLGRVRITVDEPDRVRTGMFAEAEIILRERDTLALPISAVGMGPDGAAALRVRDGVVALSPVRTGIRDGGRVEILEGLSRGDLVVAKAGAFVRDGDRINPVSRPASDGPTN